MRRFFVIAGMAAAMVMQGAVIVSASDSLDPDATRCSECGSQNLASNEYCVNGATVEHKRIGDSVWGSPLNYQMDHTAFYCGACSTPHSGCAGNVGLLNNIRGAAKGEGDLKSAVEAAGEYAIVDVAHKVIHLRRCDDTDGGIVKLTEKQAKLFEKETEAAP